MSLQRDSHFYVVFVCVMLAHHADHAPSIWLMIMLHVDDGNDVGGRDTESDIARRTANSTVRRAR